MSWQSQKQRVVALSSCEAEYIAGATAACQGVWLSRLLADLVIAKIVTPLLYIDNKSALALAKNPVFHERSKHMFVSISSGTASTMARWRRITSGPVTSWRTCLQSRSRVIDCKSCVRGAASSTPSQRNMIRGEYDVISLLRCMPFLFWVCPSLAVSTAWSASCACVYFMQCA